MHKLRAGVVGLGFGQWHVRTLATMDDWELVAMADRHPQMEEGLEAYARAWGAQPYADGIEMIEREELDAVALCVPPRARESLLRAAAEQGVAIFVEKPWASDVAHARHLVDLCAQARATVMLGFSFRFHPAIVKLRALLRQTLGPAWLVNGSYVFNWLPPAENWLWQPNNGHGFFNENSCHLFDALNALLGEPVSVSAEGSIYAGSPSEDGAAITVRYQSGAVAAVTCGGVGARAYDDYPRLDVFGAHGQAHLQGRGHVWESLSWATRDAGPGELHTLEAPPEVGSRTRYTDAWEHFAHCLHTGEAPEVGPQDGVRTVAMAMAVYTSIRTGQRVTLEDMTN